MLIKNVIFILRITLNSSSKMILRLCEYGPKQRNPLLRNGKLVASFAVSNTDKFVFSQCILYFIKNLDKIWFSFKILHGRLTRWTIRTGPPYGKPHNCRNNSILSHKMCLCLYWSCIRKHIHISVNTSDEHVPINST